MTAYWIGVAVKDHVITGVKGGFAQLGHGKESAVKGLRKGDWIAYYAPRTALDGGDKVQAFTALGRVTSDTCYQVQVREGFAPFRVNVDYIGAKDVPIHPLLELLNLTKDRGTGWGMAVRGSKIRTDIHDMALIAQGMGVSLEDPS